MKTCADRQTKICRAYIGDCYFHLARAYNECNGAERQILKKNINDMLDRVKSLLNNEKVDEIPAETVEEPPKKKIKKVETNITDEKGEI